MSAEDKLYPKILDTMLVLRDVSEKFRFYSAKDIKSLIASKMKSKREPRDLQQLYTLEAMIANLRESMTEEKYKIINSVDDTPI